MIGKTPFALFLAMLQDHAVFMDHQDLELVIGVMKNWLYLQMKLHSIKGQVINNI